MLLSGTVTVAREAMICKVLRFVRDYDLSITTTSILLLSYLLLPGKLRFAKDYDLPGTTICQGLQLRYYFCHISQCNALISLDSLAAFVLLPPDSLGGPTVASVQQRRHRHQTARFGVSDDVGPLPRQQVSGTYRYCCILHSVVYFTVLYTSHCCILHSVVYFTLLHFTLLYTSHCCTSHCCTSHCCTSQSPFTIPINPHLLPLLDIFLLPLLPSAARYATPPAATTTPV